MPFLRLLSCVGAASCLLLSGCFTTTGVSTGTQYLAGIGPVSPTGPRTPNSPVDNVSYWDGAGVGGSPSIRINLAEQKAYFYKGGQLVGVSMISSGREGYNTPPGRFKIIQKNRNHRSNLYGEIIDAYGVTINNDADIRTDKVPPGGKFVGAPMPYFMRIHGGVGMHAGYLPGYAASHGCIRMPEHMAETFFANAPMGTPVTVQ